MARTDRLKRLRAELWLLEEAPEGLTAKELSRTLSVSTRTVQRDLLTLRASGYPLSAAGARWRFIEGVPLPTTLAVDGAAQAPEHDRVQLLDRAIRHRRPIEAEYWPFVSGAPLIVRLAPLALRYFEGSLFVVAREHPAGRLRSLALERLTSIVLSRRRFSREPAEVLEDFLRDFFAPSAAQELLRVIVRFHPDIAWRVAERTWHPSQRVSLEDSGHAVVALRVPGFSWVQAWVLGFGSKAVVVEPPELVWRIFDELGCALETYRRFTDGLSQLDLFERRK